MPPLTVFPPRQDMTLRCAYEAIVSGDVELVPASKLANQTSANAVIPYPPGIPLLLSGENLGHEGSPQMAYLESLAEYDRRFPGFEHETEGAEVIDGVYHILCVKKTLMRMFFSKKNSSSLVFLSD